MSNVASSLAHLATADHSVLTRGLLRRAVRHVALLRAVSAGISHAPSLDDRIGTIERAREELLQLEQAAQIYADLTGENLLTTAELCIAELTIPSTWLEASIAQLVLCLAARVELEEQPQLVAALGTNMRRALACENEHINAARAALFELEAPTAGLGDLTGVSLQRWVSVALGTLEEGRFRTRYLHALEQVLGPIGLHLPH